MQSLSRHPLAALLPLFLVLIIDTMGVGLTLPLIGPLFLAKTGGILAADTSHAMREFWYGINLTCFAVCMFLGSPFWGDLSDYLGRKKVLIFCLLGTAMGIYLCAIAVMLKSLSLFLIGRSISGYMAGSQGIAQAVIVDVSSKEQKAQNIGLMTFVICIGLMLGPVLGGLFSDPRLSSHFNYSTPFFIYGCLAILNAGYLGLTFKETFYPVSTIKVNLKKAFLLFVNGFKRKEISWLSWVFFLEQLAFVIYFMFMPLFLVQTFAYTQRGIGYFLAYFGLIWAITSLLIIRWLMKFFTAEKIIWVCLAAILLGLFGETAAAPELMHWLLAIPIVMGDGLVFALLIAIFSNRTNENEQGEIMGLTNGIAAAAWGVAGLVLGVVANFAYLPLILATAFMVIALILFFVDQKSVINTTVSDSSN